MKWNKGNPPHIGWWEASNCQQRGIWRWWDGKSWSEPVNHHANEWHAGQCASTPEQNKTPIEWTWYWPENARVERKAP